ncbi:hypothetical protein M8494_25550 [Serratia ureilytica]
MNGKVYVGLAKKKCAARTTWAPTCADQGRRHAGHRSRRPVDLLSGWRSRPRR